MVPSWQKVVEHRGIEPQPLIIGFRCDYYDQRTAVVLVFHVPPACLLTGGVDRIR